MAQTVSNLANVIKDAWTSDRIEKQFYNENPLLEKFKSVKGTMIGTRAQVPVHKGRSGGYTSVLPAGGSLNSAGSQSVDQAYYTLPYHWFQVALETAVLNEAGGGLQSVVAGKDLEIQGAIDDTAKQCSRQLAMDGTGLIAQCTTSSSTTTINLLTTGFGPDAITRGWLYPGLTIDIGTTSDTDTIATGVTITAVSEANSTITISGSTVTTSSSHYVSIANPNSASAANPELNGLRNIVKASGSLGAIDPANAGSEYWAAAYVDSSTTAFSLDLALDLQRKVQQKTGKMPNYVVTSLKQQAAFYALLQNQVRFSSDQLGAGNVNGVRWNGMEVNGLPDILDRDWFCLTIEDFIRVTGNITKPTWVSDLEGAGGQLRWSQGNTSFVDAVVYPVQVGVSRRNSHSAATALTA